MKFLENLKSIFDAKIKDILKNNKITIFDFSKNTTNNVLEIKDGQKLSIDVNRATPEEQKLIKETIIDVIVHQNRDVFLYEKSSEKVKQIKNNLPEGANKELLSFYKDKLTPDMFKALEASVVVRNAFKKEENIAELKRDISLKYPEIGNNLCNLVSQGYFDQHFKDLYNSMFEEDDFDISIYQRKVGKIVKSLPYTVFITRFKTYDEMSEEVNFKLEKLKKYGAGKLLVHGIGKENTNTALTILEEYKNDKSITIEKELNSNKTIITATLNF